MAVTFQRQAAEGPLLLADISGYTSFLQDVEVTHRDDAFANGAVPDAYGLMSSLLDGIVARIAPPFTLSKIEGDAVFAFATLDADVPIGEALLDCIRSCYADFSARLAQAGEVWTCTCDACARAAAEVVGNGAYLLISAAAASSLKVKVEEAIPMTETYEHYAPIDTFAIPLGVPRPA